MIIKGASREGTVIDCRLNANAPAISSLKLVQRLPRYSIPRRAFIIKAVQVTLASFTIKNCAASYYNDPAGMPVEHNPFRAPLYSGGAIYAVNAHLTIANTIIHNNVAGDGGALFAVDSYLSLNASTISMNRADAGSAIRLNRSSRMPSKVTPTGPNTA